MVRLLISGSLLAFTLAACGPSESLKIGFISGQTGPFSDLGQAGLNGAILAIEEKNAAGGIQHQPIKMLIRNDEHTPSKAREGFEQLQREGVVAIIGPMTSAMAATLVPEANKTEMVMMGGTVVTNLLSGKDDYFFRAIGSTAHYATYSAAAHFRELKPSQVSVVFDNANRDYAENWAQDYAREMTRLSGRPVNLIEIDSRVAQHIHHAQEKIQAQKPDLVVFACSAKTTAGLMRSLRTQNTRVRFATSAWAANHALLDIAGQAAEGTLVEQYHNLGDQSPTYRRFVEHYEQRFKQPVDYAAVVAFDATNILLEALAQHPRRDGLKHALLTRHTYPGLQAPIIIDRTGDAERPAFTTRVRAGQFVPLP